MAAKRSHYDVLGVPHNATPEQIKKAFRALALRYHPDRTKGDPAAEPVFREAAAAFEVLSDPDRRAVYDRFGDAGLRDGRHGMRDFSDVSLHELFERVFGDLFSEVFGGAPFGPEGSARRGRNVAHNLTISLDEAIGGADRVIEVPRLKPCGTCHGTGAAPGTRILVCKRCNGTGKISLQQGFFAMARACPACDGTGRTIPEPCPTCVGSGHVTSLRRVAVKVPAGIDSGQRLRFAGEGEPGADGGADGDLIVTVEVAPHPLYKRDGSTLICELPLSFAQAALGAVVDVPLPGGGATTLNIPAGTASASRFVLHGRGMPSVSPGHPRGDLVLITTIVVPKSLTPRQRELLDAFARESDGGHNEESRGFWSRVAEVLGIDPQRREAGEAAAPSSAPNDGF